MRGKRDTAPGLHLPDVERHRLSDEEELWIARQLEKAPPLGDAARRRVEQLLALPPERSDAVRREMRAS
ncbi:MAG: hypothetical protein QOD97_3916 [Mycobacterium sp.]|jgi:hypothetical protein|nr:hypothetical protein [Pseudonocardiales bacterium]MDT5241718.1 hypothetical protein [Mycobacterium sp.]